MKILQKIQTFNPLKKICFGFILLREICGGLALKFNLPVESLGLQVSHC
jgi:hypothetical protein